MATKNPPKPNPKGTPAKGGGLNRKVGPLPLKYWLGIGAGILFLLFLYFRSKNANAADANDVPLVPIPISPQQAASAGTPSPNSPPVLQLSPETLAELGVGMPSGYVTASDLQSQLDSLGSNVASQIAAATFANQGAVNSTNAPAAPSAPAVKTATGAPVKKTNPTGASAPVRYYTYAPGKAPKGRKADEIPVKVGKTIKFKKGSGYYYA